MSNAPYLSSFCFLVSLFIVLDVGIALYTLIMNSIYQSIIIIAEKGSFFTWLAIPRRGKAHNMWPVIECFNAKTIL